MNEEKICYCCDSITTEENGVQWGSYFYCEECFKDKHCRVDNYHRPSLETKFLKENGETTDLYFGFELEVNTSNYGFNNDDHVDAIYYIRKNFKHLCLNFEFDGSIGNGFEIVSQPMTYKYIKKHEEDFRQILKYLSENGYQSHNSGKCGLHVHVSKKFLGNTDEEIENTTNKITLFVETYASNIQTLSRRGRGTYNEYIIPLYKGNMSNVIPNDDYFKSTQILKDLKSKTQRYMNGSRYFVVNTTNENTLEYRMFKGTLKFETFMATLEFVNNLTNVCKYNAVSKISWNKVINYTGDYIKDYNNSLNIIGDTYLRDYTEQIQKNIDIFKESINQNILEYNTSLQDIINKINDVLNEKVDLSSDYNQINQLFSYKSYIFGEIRDILVKKEDPSNISMFDYLEKMFNGTSNYKKNFKKLYNILDYYKFYTELPEEFKNKINELLELVEQQIIEESTNI